MGKNREGQPGQGRRVFAWLLDGATPQERSAITENIPAPVLKIITALFGRARKNVAPVWKLLNPGTGGLHGPAVFDWQAS